MQLNLTILHQAMSDTAERWFGFVPDDRLPTSRVKIGGANSAWPGLLDQATRALTRGGEVSSDSVPARHIEDMPCVSGGAFSRIMQQKSPRLAVIPYVR